MTFSFLTNRIPKASKTYFPNLHHIRAELERAVTDDGIPVLGSSDTAPFPSFSGSGYVVASQNKVRTMNQYWIWNVHPCILLPDDEEEKEEEEEEGEVNGDFSNWNDKISK